MQQSAHSQNCLLVPDWCFCDRELVLPPRPSIIEVIQVEEERALMEELVKARQKNITGQEAEVG